MSDTPVKFVPGDHVRLKLAYATPKTLGTWVIEKFLSKNYQLVRPNNPMARKLRARPYMLEHVTSSASTTSTHASSMSIADKEVTIKYVPLPPGTIVTVKDPKGAIGNELHVVHADNTLSNGRVSLSRLGGGQTWHGIPRAWLTVVSLNELRFMLSV